MRRVRRVSACVARIVPRWRHGIDKERQLTHELINTTPILHVVEGGLP